MDTTHDVGFRCTFSFSYPFNEERVTFRVCLYMNDEATGYNPWRHMDNGSWWPPYMPNPPTPDDLAYNLYADSGRTHILSPPDAGPSMVSEVLTIERGYPGQPISGSGNFTVHGRLPAPQPGLPSGSYNATPSFTLTYTVESDVAPSDCTQASATQNLSVTAQARIAAP